MSDHVTDSCNRCGQRQVDDGHEQRCAAEELARQAAETVADQYDFHRFRAVDLWAHLRSHPIGLTDDQAAGVVRLVCDLGWRPVVGALAMTCPALTATPNHGTDTTT